MTAPDERLATLPQPRRLTAGVVLIALSLALFFSNLGAHDLWGPDEVRYALVAREMRETGQYIVPHLNGDLYMEKPPLMFWLTNVFADLQAWVLPFRGIEGEQLQSGQYVNEVTARLPSAVAALCTLLLVWRMGARRWDEWTGLLAAIILGTNVQFFWFARAGALDMLLTLCVTVAVLAGVRIVDAERPRWFWICGVGFGLAAGSLTKGPVVVLMTALIVGSYGWSVGRGRRAAVVLTLGTLLALLLVAPWWRAAFEQSGGAFGHFSELARQTVGRAVNSPSHQKPFYHYAVGLLGEFLPWSLFVPMAVWSAWRARGTEQWGRLRLSWCWVVVPFFVFSAMSGKRGQYLLPIYPGLALLVAGYFRQYATDLRPLSRVRSVLIPTGLLAVGFLGAGVVAVVGGAALPLLLDRVASGTLPEILQGGVAAARPFVVPAIGGGTALVCLGMWSLLHHLPRPPSRVLATISVCTTLMFGFVAGGVLPALDRVKSARSFATTVRGFSEVGTDVVLYNYSFRPDIAYYYGKRLRVENPSAIAGVGAGKGPVLGIMQEKHYKQLRDQIPAEFFILHREQISSRRWLLLSNTPPTT